MCAPVRPVYGTTARRREYGIVARELLLLARTMEHAIVRLCFVTVALCLGALVYVYAGFPLLLALLTSRKSKRYRPPADAPENRLPSVSLIVAAYNEEVVIGEKIRNSLALDYPVGKLECIFVSDSTDRTNEILKQNESQRVRALILPERRGKVHALHAALRESRGEIVVFSDANTFYRPDAVRKLVRHFQEPRVGVVTGDVRILASGEAFGAGEGLYYRYERKLQEIETDFWSTVAIDGAMYAVRAADLGAALVTSGQVDDVATAMNVARADLRIIYDPEAIAEEPPTPTSAMEFQRKVRVVAYAIQSVLRTQGVPRLRQGRLLWTYVSHKVLRWLAPVFLIGALLACFTGAFFSPGLAWLFAAQVLFYLMAAMGSRGIGGFACRIPYYFSMVNLAALFGLVRGMRMSEGEMWARTDRIPAPAAQAQRSS